MHVARVCGHEMHVMGVYRGVARSWARGRGRRIPITPILALRHNFHNRVERFDALTGPLENGSDDAVYGTADFVHIQDDLGVADVALRHLNVSLLGLGFCEKLVAAKFLLSEFFLLDSRPIK